MALGALSVQLRTETGVPQVRLTSDTSKPIKTVDIYYSIDPHVLTRLWRDALAREEDGVWVADCPVMSVDHPLFIFANVTYEADLDAYSRPLSRRKYENKFALSSNMLRLTPEELKQAKVKATDQPERLIEDFKRGWHDWYRLSWGNPVFWVAGTRKLKDPKYRSPEGAALLLDVKSEKDNILVFEFAINRWRPYPGQSGGRYTVVKEIQGSTQWQTIEVTEEELAPSTLDQPEYGKPGFDYITELTLSSRGTVVRIGQEQEIQHRWQGSKHGQFRDLRWSGGKYADKIEVSGGTVDIPEEELNKLIQQAIDESLAK